MGAGREPLSKLDEALKQVYRVFRRAKKPEHLKNRMDFLQKREEARLLGRPRKELAAADLYYYVDECGGKLEHRELAYFIPRICEILASGQAIHGMLGWAFSLQCLKYSDFPSHWPDNQAQAIQRFIESLILTYVEEPARFDDVECLGELIQMAARAGIALKGILDELSKADEHRLACGLAIWIDGACFLSGPAETNQAKEWRDWLAFDAYWIGTEHPQKVSDWLVGLKPWHLIREAAEREADPELREQLGRVAEFCAAWPEAEAPSP